jgi:hypothetical protein
VGDDRHGDRNRFSSGGPDRHQAPASPPLPSWPGLRDAIRSGAACLAASLPVAYVAVAGAFGGASLIIFESLWQTSVQRSIPESMLSRASSYDYFGSLVTFPIGLAIAGPLAALDGPRAILLSVGALEILVLTATLLSPSVSQHVDG